MKKLFLAVMLSLGLAGSAVAQAAPDKPFRLCTGDSTLNYFTAGNILKKKSDTKIDVIASSGSLDNLEKIMSGDCDGGYVQSDSLFVYSNKNPQSIPVIERVGILYQEHIHLLCNRDSGIGRITDLTSKNTIAVGSTGSGARTTWDSFILADKKRYGVVQTDSRSGLRAVMSIADGSDVQCGLFVSAINSNFMKTDAQSQGDKVVLTAADDWDVGKVKDSKGKEFYSYFDIPSGTYPAIQKSGSLWGTKPVKTIAVDAVFVVNKNWINSNEQRFNNVLRGFANAKNDIAAIVKPK